MKQIIAPAGRASSTFSPAVRKEGTTVYMSGQVGTDARGVAAADVVEQVDQAFRNLQAVVEAANGTMDDVVKLTIYISDRAHRDAVADARRRHFADGRHPATTLLVCGLAKPEYVVEVDAIAVVDWP